MYRRCFAGLKGKSSQSCKVAVWKTEDQKGQADRRPLSQDGGLRLSCPVADSGDRKSKRKGIKMMYDIFEKLKALNTAGTVVTGTPEFLVVGLGEEDFVSLSPELAQKYEEEFHQPEAFLPLGRRLMVIPVPDESVQSDAEKAVSKPPVEHDR